MNLEKVSTEDLILELTKRKYVNALYVFQNAGFKIRLPEGKVIKDKGEVTILICKTKNKE